MKALIILTFLLSGCVSIPIPEVKEVVKTPTSIDGSRADGVVTMGYTYHNFEIVSVDWVSADNEANLICREWDYAEAKSFHTLSESCPRPSVYGCFEYQVTIRYRCVR